MSGLKSEEHTRTVGPCPAIYFPCTRAEKGRFGPARPMGILWRPQSRISQPRLAHDVSSEMSKRDLGPLALGFWVSGVLQSDRRCNLGDGWEGSVPVGTCWGQSVQCAAVPKSLQTPRTPESGERDGRNGQKFNNGEDQRGGWTGQTSASTTRMPPGCHQDAGVGCKCWGTWSHVGAKATKCGCRTLADRIAQSRVE